LAVRQAAFVLPERFLGGVLAKPEPSTRLADGPKGKLQFRMLDCEDFTS
jgi:hypothetical protein